MTSRLNETLHLGFILQKCSASGLFSITQLLTPEFVVCSMFTLYSKFTLTCQSLILSIASLLTVSWSTCFE